MTVPSWWSFLLLALAAFRSFRLVAEDTILDPLRLRIVGLPRNWKEGDPVPKGYREKLAEFVTCPWCAGFWISIAWWAAFQAWHFWTIVAASLMALSGVVGLLGKIDALLTNLLERTER
jgi:uncharacterized protein DUF1360